MNKENGNKHRLKHREPFFARGKVDKGILVERNWLIRGTINAPYIGEQRAINRCTLRNWTKRGKRRERLSSFHPHRNPCFLGIRELRLRMQTKGESVGSRISTTKKKRKKKKENSKANLTGYSSSRRITGTYSRGKNIDDSRLVHMQPATWGLQARLC